MTSTAKALARIALLLAFGLLAGVAVSLGAGRSYNTQLLLPTIDLLLLGSATYFFVTIGQFRQSVGAYSAGLALSMLTGFYLVMLFPLLDELTFSARDWSSIAIFVTGAGLTLGLNLNSVPPYKTVYVAATISTGILAGTIFSSLLLLLKLPAIPLIAGLLSYVYAGYRAYSQRMQVTTVFVAFGCLLSGLLLAALNTFLYPNQAHPWLHLIFTGILLLLPYAALSDYFLRERVARGGLASTLDPGLKDPLTGLANRRTMDTLGEKLYRRCDKQDVPCSILMIDIDHFKQINDLYGHPAGDEILRQFARIITGQVRPTDLVVRYGGEEFTVLLPGAALGPAIRLAERIRVSIQAAAFEHESNSFKITSSIGVAAVYPGDWIDLKELVSRADTNLYRAKRYGRNQVMSDALMDSQAEDD